MNDETLAALERVATALEHQGLSATSDYLRLPTLKDAALIRALIDTLRQGSERRYGDVAMAMAYDCGHAAGMAEATAKAVAYANRREEDWRIKEQAYRKTGNAGPYLGEPRWHQFATAIKAGAHLASEGE